MTRPVRLCANPATLAAYRASRPTLAEENARLRAELAEAQAEILRLRAAVAEHPDIGLTPIEARIYAALKKADGVMTRKDLAAAASTTRHSVAPGSIATISAQLRKILAEAGEPWTIEGVNKGAWGGSGYRLAPREVTA